MPAILIVAAHPDDEILGCGGTAARFIRQGYDVYTLILGEGVTSRDAHRDIGKRSSDLAVLQGQLNNANKRLGVKKIYLKKFPDNRFDSVPLLDIVKAVEEVKCQVKPAIIFTHFEHDLNIDHEITYRAVITATRPMKNESTRELYSFEIPSSTDWRYPLAFAPDTFFNISETLKIKLDALRQYKSEMRGFPHPRSLKSIKLLGEYWGSKIGVAAAEAFKTIRIVR